MGGEGGGGAYDSFQSPLMASDTSIIESGVGSRNSIGFELAWRFKFV